MTPEALPPIDAPDRPPRAAVGWGDLLAFRQLESDPVQRAEAARLLGLPNLGDGLFDHLKPPELPKKPAPKEPPKKNADSKPIPRIPLTCPQLLLSRVVPTPDPAEARREPDPLPSWSSDEASEVEAMLLPTGKGQRLAPCIWPLEATRKAARSASRLRQGACLDLPRLLQRLARAQWPYPFPQQARRSQSRHLVLLMDWCDDLTLFRDDFSCLFNHLKRQLRGVEIEYDWLMDGPSGTLFSKGRSEETRRAWSSDTTLVLVSNLGAADPLQVVRWQRYLRALRRKLGAVMVLNPLQTGVAAPADGVSASQLDTLLSALSPAITVEPALIRAMRLAVIPDSTPALEIAVWSHPDLVGALPFRQWRLQEQNQSLGRLRQQPASLRAKVAKTLHAFHDHVCPLQRDDEWILWGRVADAETRRLSGELIGCEPDTAGARERGEKVARHLFSLSSGEHASDSCAQGKQGTTALVSLKARDRLERFGFSASDTSPMTLRCLLDAAAKHPETIELPPGTTVPTELLVQAGEKGLVLLYQIGSTIWIVRQASDWVRYYGLGYPEGKKQAELAFIQQTKTRLVQAIVDGPWLEWQGPSGKKLIWLESLYGPMKIDEWSGLLHQNMQLKWRGGGVEILPVERVQGAGGWGMKAHGSDLAEPSVDVSGLLKDETHPLHGDELHLFSKEDSLGVLRHRLVTTGIAVAVVGDEPRDSFGLGVDEYGCYLQWELPAPRRGDMHQRGQEIRRHGDIAMRFRYLPPGTFLMGSPDGVGESDEHPQQPVTISQGFWMAETPCTQALWLEVMGNNPSHSKAGHDALRRPVENVSFRDVNAFLQKLESLLPSGVEPVLPTEAQWEYACRAGTQTAFWWGNDADDSKANWNEQNHGTTPVNRYQPNSWGLHDMHGNVWEVCADFVRKYQTFAQIDPVGTSKEKVVAVRGGSWFNIADRARAAYRGTRPMDGRNQSVGFRFTLRLRSVKKGGRA
ncbi:formylglycine-generating enzyme family protein [Hydrogenophaga taeniospiralis]|uniref:formylglycine-generating enzyme family protein n=1 Tax=Hydrogenophaga taeniospiralis TaxID=65656 RepID=UPI001CFA5EE6|nr:formylglycine-generating enzyme family protein [Hydrogenophaga taeniospiralis]UCU95026.1 SUMF1/EgtB/PvdO family nonheme iron enzyme [Hydrogenophaga taeniospiralis]